MWPQQPATASANLGGQPKCRDRPAALGAGGRPTAPHGKDARVMPTVWHCSCGCRLGTNYGGSRAFRRLQGIGFSPKSDISSLTRYLKQVCTTNKKATIEDCS